MASAITTKHTLLQIEYTRGFALQPSRSQIAVALTAGVAVDINMSDLADVDGKIPTYLNFGCAGVFFVKWNGTGATVPTTDLTGEAAEITPSLRKVDGITSFSLVAAANAVVQIGLYVGN